MGKDDHSNRYSQQPEIVQSSNQMHGLYKGIVVDVRDPFGLGRVRVWSYPLHGDFDRIPIEAIPWAEPIVAIPRSFHPPEMWDRVWISFDSGDKYAPVYLGFWYGVPSGEGRLPYSRKVGTEVRPENWHFHDLYPETIMLGGTAEGAAVWMHSKYSGGREEGALVSGINLMDVAGKFISISSLDPTESNYSGVFGDSSEQIYVSKADIPEGAIARTGTNDADLDPVVGSIDIGHQFLERRLLSGTGSFTLDEMLQTKDEMKFGIETQSVTGDIYHERQEKTFVDMNSESMVMTASKSVFVNNLFTVPRRYDK